MLLSGSRVASYFTTGSSSSSGGVVSTDTLPTKCIVLSDLSYIAVTGTDARRFLQGICTNDISKLKPAAGDCLATSLLNNKGRILFNLLIYTLKDKNVHSSEQHLLDNSSVEVSDGLFLLAELHTHNVAEFQRYLNLYKLRSKVDIRSLEADCLFISNTFSTHQLASLNDCNPDVLVAAIDPRLEGFGTRVVINKNGTYLEKV
jgi:folate-binding Fe-S cluster repair protein YgfZ